MKYVNPDLLYDYYNQYLRYWRSQEKIWWLERERERDRAPNWLNTTMTRSLICVTTAATSILLICQHVLRAQVAKMRIWIKKTNEAITYCVMWLWGPIERFRQERYQYLTFSLSLFSLLEMASNVEWLTSSASGEVSPDIYVCVAIIGLKEMANQRSQRTFPVC